MNKNKIKGLYKNKISLLFIVLALIIAVLVIIYNKESVKNSTYNIQTGVVNKTDNNEILEERTLDIVGDITEKGENNIYTVLLNFQADKCIKNIYDVTDENNKNSILSGNEELGKSVETSYNMVKNRKYKFQIELASGYKLEREYEVKSAELSLGKATKNSDGTWSFPNFEIKNPCGDEIKYATIQFASGIQSGDKLTISSISGATVNSAGTSVSLNLQNQNINEIQTAVRNNLKVTLTDRDGVVSIKGALTDEIIDRTMNYCVSTGHYYEYVPQPAITWTAAKEAAEQKSYMGMKGYLATLLSKEEQDFAASLIDGWGWLGGTCDFNYILDKDGNKIYNNIGESAWNWYWVTGPEAGTKFWDRTGTLNAYSNWDPAQPDNAGGEYYLHIWSNKMWNDLPNGYSGITGYIVEYGGMPNDVITLDESYSDVVTISIGLVEPEPTPTPTAVSGIPQIKVGEQTVILTKENVADYYGKVVTNYSATSSATWRLFYVDFDGKYGEEGKIYLKADQIDITQLDLTASAESESALSNMKKINPDWAKNDGVANENNEKAVLWLCDETQWSAYKNNNYADYAIGALSVEMYTDSYNTYHTRKGTTGYEQIKCKWFSSNISGYKYAVGCLNENFVEYISSNSLKSDSYNMYVKSNQLWWLASPSTYDSNTVNLVNGSDFNLDCNYYYHFASSYGICPLVSLKLGFQPELAN